MSQSFLHSPYDRQRNLKLVTVSPSPESATRLVTSLARTLRDQCTVIHAANCERVEEVKFRVRDLQPDILVQLWSSKWSPEQLSDIRATARQMKADISLHEMAEDGQDGTTLDVINKCLAKRMS